jgi:thiamine-monophosphate kinase
MPRVALGRALIGMAHACIDLSDGLLADLGHVCRGSGNGSDLDLDSLPASEALMAFASGDARRFLQVAGGDDYELCFTAPSNRLEDVQRLADSVGVQLSWVGRITAKEGVRAFDADALEWQPPRKGYEHFG